MAKRKVNVLIERVGGRMMLTAHLTNGGDFTKVELKRLRTASGWFGRLRGLPSVDVGSCLVSENEIAAMKNRGGVSQANFKLAFKKLLEEIFVVEYTNARGK